MRPRPRQQETRPSATTHPLVFHCSARSSITSRKLADERSRLFSFQIRSDQPGSGATISPGSGDDFDDRADWDGVGNEADDLVGDANTTR